MWITSVEIHKITENIILREREQVGVAPKQSEAQLNQHQTGPAHCTVQTAIMGMASWRRGTKDHFVHSVPRIFQDTSTGLFLDQRRLGQDL